MPSREPPMGDVGHTLPVVMPHGNGAMKVEPTFQQHLQAGTVYPQETAAAMELLVQPERRRVVVPTERRPHHATVPVFSVAPLYQVGLPIDSYSYSAHVGGTVATQPLHLPRDTLTGLGLGVAQSPASHDAADGASGWPQWRSKNQLAVLPEGNGGMQYLALTDAFNRRETPTRATMVEGSDGRGPTAPLHPQWQLVEMEPAVSHPPSLGSELEQQARYMDRLDMLAVVAADQQMEDASSEASQLETSEGEDTAHNGTDVEHSGITSRPKRHICPSCGKPCRSPSELRNHVSIKHNGFKPWKCTKCHSSYSTKSNMMAHSRRCGLDGAVPKAYPCNASGCEKSYNHPCDRDDHFHAVHVGQKRHKCVVCGLLCYSMSNRNKHMVRRHPEVGAASAHGSVPAPLLDMIQQTASVPYPTDGVLVGS